MGTSGMYGPSDRGESLATIHAALGADIIPLVGARRRDRLDEALGALEIELPVEDLAAIETAVPKDAAAGDRYAAAQMASLDSERG